MAQEPGKQGKAYQGTKGSRTAGHYLDQRSGSHSQDQGILSCYDFSATPFAPSGKKNDEEALFGWIVSDFGLNDGIESGLVKTPRVVVRDDGTPDAESFRSKLYHIYADETVKDDINRAADPEEPLPDLLTQAYYLLGKDWQALYYAWKDAGADVPPVMITVANRTETAARIKYAFDHGRIPVPELCDPNLTIHIDSKNNGCGYKRGYQLLTKIVKQKSAKQMQQQFFVRLLTQLAKRQTRRANSKCDFCRHAIGRMGCKNSNTYFGIAGVFQPASLRTGCWSWPSPDQL